MVTTALFLSNGEIMDGIIFLGIFLGLFLGILYRGIKENKRTIETWKKTFKENYGKINSREWKSDELEKITHYNKIKKTDNEIDELTWNDLNMDEIYKQMAFTSSSLGDDYLYYMLRNPVREEKELIKLEEKISVMVKEESTRISIQVLFAKIGRMKRYSFADYILYLMQIETKSNLKHHIANGIILFSFVLISYNMGLGVFLFFGIILYNIITYFKEKAYLEPYLLSLRYLLKNLEYAKEAEGILPVEWTKEKQKLHDILCTMKKIQKNSYLLLSPGRMMGEGLELVLDYIRMCFHIDIIKFHQMLKQIQRHEYEIWKLYEIMGKTDAVIAIAQYRESLSYTSCPTFHKEKTIYMEKGYHPLIQNAVSNSLCIERNILLTGSNASGKSTFLKTVGVNVLLAQTVHTCVATKMELPFCKVYTSMSLKDNLLLKESYYMAEIKAIKRILDAADEEIMVVCMVDEVLRGTNTMERIAASTQILKYMTDKNILCMAATHDVELTRTLEKSYDNYHFEESMKGQDVEFSYQLKSGRAQSCNAINLLENLEYDKSLIQNARDMVKNFEEKGEWICK